MKMWLNFFLDFVLRPYIVYMAKESDIIEDWTAIKKVRN